MYLNFEYNRVKNGTYLVQSNHVFVDTTTRNINDKKH